ncbi:MAG TPA: hypothetical protein VFU46_11115 [Gemmatimonadales bacterium]|nr:hypothetical protein [Gemmatimonadales bacterium]
MRHALAVVACVLVPPLHAQRAARVDDFLALTGCEAGRPVTIVRPDVERSSLAEEIEAHEAVHRAQAAEYLSCEAFLAGIRSARRTIEVELPAYCAQWRVAVARGADSAATRREFAWRIAAQSGAMENRLEVLSWFERDCS